MTSDSRDPWDPGVYSTSLEHIARLSGPLQALLTPNPADKILDIGCGDGALTAVVAAKVPQGQVVGLDSSPAMVEHATKRHATTQPNLRFLVHDCSKLDVTPKGLSPWETSWDWVFSNSCFHWILGAPEARTSLLPNIYRLLKRGGSCCFEFGGAGQLTDAITALTAALVVFGIPAEQRERVNPWFFPSAEWMREALETAGFEVLECDTHYRPTRTSLEDGTLEGFVRQLGFPYLDAIAPDDGPKRDEVVRWVCEVLNASLKRKEDGSRWMGYVRLRVLARKP